MDGLVYGSTINTEEIVERVGWLVPVVLAVALLVGLLNCFLGYKLFKFMVSLTAGAVLAVAGAALAAACTESKLLFYVVTVGFFALGLWLGYKLYKVGLFLYLLVMAAVVSMVVFSTFMGLEGGALLVLAVLVGIVVAVLGVVLVKPVVIVMTGLSGAFSAGTVLALLMGIPSMRPVFGVVLAVLGIVVQFMLEKKAVALAQPMTVQPPAWHEPVQPEPVREKPVREKPAAENGQANDDRAGT